MCCGGTRIMYAFSYVLSQEKVVLALCAAESVCLGPSGQSTPIVLMRYSHHHHHHPNLLHELVTLFQTHTHTHQRHTKTCNMGSNLPSELPLRFIISTLNGCRTYYMPQHYDF